MNKKFIRMIVCALLPLILATAAACDGNSPAITTEAPAVTTTAPAVTTEAPVVTTEAPVVTTEAPVATTEAPVVTTEAPVVTTEAPVVTTEAPAVTTAAPVVDTEVPAIVTASDVDGIYDPTFLSFPNVTVTATDYQEGNEPEHLFDGIFDGSDTGVRWSVKGFPNVASIDLGEEVKIDKLIVYVAKQRPYSYTIEVSTDNANFVTIIDANETVRQDFYTYSLSPVNVRYIRLTVTGTPVSTEWISIQELMLYAAD